MALIKRNTNESVNLSDILHDIRSEVKSDIQKELSENEDLQRIARLSLIPVTDKLVNLHDKRSGRVYLLATREQVFQPIADKPYRATQVKDHTLEKMAGEDHFNLNYQGETYYSFAQIHLNKEDSLEINSDYQGKLLLAIEPD